MNSRERVLTALKHKEPDRVPFDIGGSVTTGIHKVAYKNLLEYLGIKNREIITIEYLQQLAMIDEDILTRFNVDIRPIATNMPEHLMPEFFIEENHEKFYDQFNIKWRKPLEYGLYFDLEEQPFSNFTSVKEVEEFEFPDPLESSRYIGVSEKAQAIKDNTNAAITLAGITAGITEVACWLRGMENFMVDMMLDRKMAEAILDKVMVFKAKFWEEALLSFGDLIDVVIEADDLGTQTSQLFSPKQYRDIIKPRHKIIFDTIKKAKPDVFIFLHSCGNIYDLIPDLIEIGVDAINPVQVTAKDMDTKRLKKEFGNDLTFWGGGIDSVNILNKATPEQVKDEVKRRIHDLAPGGGFIFSAVHNIQPDVPPENIIAMIEALNEFGVYK